MRKIHENYLLLSKLKDFDSSVIKYFADRLSIFLGIDLNEYPDVLFTKSISKIYNHYDECAIENRSVSKSPIAFYDEDQNMVVFNAARYDKGSQYFYVYMEDVNIILNDINMKKYRYIIPISDIYHELIHFFQSYLNPDYYDNCKYTDIIEASDEIYTYFLSGQIIDYDRESIALWHFSKYYLKLKGMKFYIFIRDIIINPNWQQNILNNKDMIKMLADDYDGKMDNLMQRLKVDFYRNDLIDEFYKDINEIHNLIFYRW